MKNFVSLEKYFVKSIYYIFSSNQAINIYLLKNAEYKLEMVIIRIQMYVQLHDFFTVSFTNVTWIWLFFFYDTEVWENEKFSLTKKIHISSNQLFSNFFGIKVTLTNFLPKMCETKSQHWFDEIFYQWEYVLLNFSFFHTVTLCMSQCGNYRNSLSRNFGKNFVKVTVLLNKLTKSWFDEIFLWW